MEQLYGQGPPRQVQRQDRQVIFTEGKYTSERQIASTVLYRNGLGGLGARSDPSVICVHLFTAPLSTSRAE